MGTSPLPGRPVRVVVAEDQDSLRSLLCELLITEGFEVEAFGNGDELATYLLSRTDQPELWPDVILTDVRMPGHDGLKILASLRTADWTVPVILMTGFWDDNVVAAAMANHAVTVLAKPFPIETLLRTIDEAVGLRYGPGVAQTEPLLSEKAL